MGVDWSGLAKERFLLQALKISNRSELLPVRSMNLALLRLFSSSGGP